MSRINQRKFLTCVMLLVLASPGCSTLGLSLYPSTATLTSESKAVLEASRIPVGIPRENAKTVLPPHALQPGDALLIETVHLERDLRLPADQTVLADGSVDLGAYGRVVVAGRSLEQAEALIEDQVVYQLRQQLAQCSHAEPEKQAESIGQEAQDPNCNAIAINVRLLEPVHRFYVLGEVNAPGAYPLNGSETVLDAIVSAGGLTGSANPCQILLARPTDPCACRVTLPVCYREIVQMGNTATNYQLQPGDRVFVSTRSCLDELMFWKASRPCSRCSGCNRACQTPELVSAQPMTMVESTMISPGSVGQSSEIIEDLLQTEITEVGSAEPASGSSLGDYLSDGGERELLPPRGTASADVDGELDFMPRSDESDSAVKR